jgi:hypothetical protein
MENLKRIMIRTMTVLALCLLLIPAAAAAGGQASAQDDKITITYDVGGGTKGADWKEEETAVSGEKLSRILGNKVPETVPENIALPPEGQLFKGYRVIEEDGATHDFPINTSLLMTGFTVEQPVTVKYLWAEPVELTLKPSTIEKTRPVSDYVIEVPCGLSYNDLSPEKRIAAAGHFRVHDLCYALDGVVYLTEKPIYQYKVRQDIYDNDKASDPVTEDTEFYVPVILEILDVDITMGKALCGTEIDWPDGGDPTKDQFPHPDISIPKGAHYRLDKDLPPKWVDYTTFPYRGTLTGGSQCYVYVYLTADYGYGFDSDETDLNVKGAELQSVQSVWSELLWFVIQSTVEHVPDQARDEKAFAPTCTQDGSHVEVTDCKACKKELSRESVTDPKLGHDWSEWILTVKPENGKEGVETRTCSRCGMKETRPAGEKHGSGGTGRGGAVTGDESHVLLWALTLAAALMLLSVQAVRLKRRR